MLVNKKYIGIGFVSAVVVAAIVTPLVIMKTGNANGSDVPQTSKTGNTPTKTKNGDREADKNNNGDLGEDSINRGDPAAERNNNGDPEAERTRKADEAERTRKADQAERTRKADQAQRTRKADQAERTRKAEEADRDRIAQAAEQIIRDEEAEGTNNGDSGGERTNNGDTGGERTNNGDSGGERTNNGNPESATTVASQCADSSECTGDKLCVRDDSNSPTSCIAASSLSKCDEKEVLCPTSLNNNTRCRLTKDKYDSAHVRHTQCLCSRSESTKIEDNGSGSIRTCETRCSNPVMCRPKELCKKDPISKTPYCVAEGVATVCNSDILCGDHLTCVGTSNPVKCVCPENQATYTFELGRGSSTTCFQRCANTSDCDEAETLCHDGGELADLGPVCKLRSQMDNNCTGVECYANMACDISNFECRCLRGEMVRATITMNGKEFGTCHAKCTTGCTDGCRGGYCVEPVKRDSNPGQCADSSQCTADKLCVRDNIASPTYCTAASSLSNCDDQEVFCPQFPTSSFSTSCQMTEDEHDPSHTSHPQCLCLGSDSTKIEDNGSGSIRTCETQCHGQSWCRPEELCKKDPISKAAYCVAEGIATVCNSDILCGNHLTCMGTSDPVKCVCVFNKPTHRMEWGSGSLTTCFQRCANTSDCNTDQTLCHDGGQYSDVGPVCKQRHQLDWDWDCTGVECFKNMVCDNEDFDCGCDENETLRATITKSNGKKFGTCHAKCTTGCTDGCRGGYCAEPVKR